MNLLAVDFLWDTWDMPNILAQLVGSIIGAFLGFILAIKHSQKQERRHKRRLINNLQYELCNELNNKTTIKQDAIINVSDIQLISLPLLNRIVSADFSTPFLKHDLATSIKKLWLKSNRVNHLYALKIDFWLEHFTELDVSWVAKLNFDNETPSLMTKDFILNKYIAFCKTVWDETEAFFSDLKDLIEELQTLKKW